MKIRFILLPLLFSVAGPAMAWPYAVRSVSTGMDNAVTSGSGGARFDQPPVAVDFAASGRRPWYAGGLLMTNAPFPGSLTLPFILLPQAPAATVKEMASAVCDADGDGDMDVVRVNEWAGNPFIYTFQVFLNSGSGIFTAGYRFDWVNNPTWNEGQHFLQLCAGDFNSDGSPDIAVLETYDKTNTTPDPDREEGHIFIRWNDGSGQFSDSYTLKSTGLGREARISAADCDRDGDLDLACTRDEVWNADDATFHFGVYSSRLYRNNGAGIFSQSDLGARPAAFADVNRDGWPDLVSSTDVALNDGSGSFAAQVTEASGEVAAWTIADADGDGMDDLVRVEGTSLVHYKGDGLGRFASSSSRLVTLPAAATAVGAGDSDGDGDLDFFASLTDGTFAFVENRALHTLPGRRIPMTISESGITALKSADFNLDGVPDVAALVPADKSIYIFDGVSSGLVKFPEPLLTGRGGSLESAHSIVADDFDRDGRPDIAYSLPGSGAVRFARNTDDSSLVWSQTDMATGLPGISHLVAGQLGAPGKFPDLLTGNATTGQIRWIYWNNDDWFYQVASTPSPVPGAILAAPVTSSGRGDEIVFMQSTASTRTLGARQLAPSWVPLGSVSSSTITGGPHASCMVWADSGGDGKGEVVHVNGSGALATWDPVTGAVQTLRSTRGAIRGIAAVDWDRNGRADFLCATSIGLELVFWNRISNSWETTEMRNEANGVRAVTILDLNLDGWPDAAVASDAGLTIIINDPALIQTGSTASLVSVRQTGAAGQTVNALSMTSATAGRPATASQTAEVDALFTGASVYFFRENGTALTESELSALITRVRFKAGGLTVASAGPSEMETTGRVRLDYNPVLGNLVSISPGETIRLDIELELKTTAWQAGLTRFRVSLKDLYAVPNDGLTPIVGGAGSHSMLDKTGLATVEILRPCTALELWREDHFSTCAGTGSAANDADPDRDGVPNLVEYFTGTNPLAADPGPNAFYGLTLIPGSSVYSPVKLRLHGTTTALADPKVRVTIQYATNSLQSWTTFATRTGGGIWTGVVPITVPPSNGRSALIFESSILPAITPKFLVRLKVEELP